MSNNELILTKEVIKALATAESLVAFQDGNHHKLVVYPNRDAMMHSTIPLKGSIWGGGYDNHKYGKSSAYLSYRKDAFKLLKVGDSIELEWHPDNGSEFTRKRGLVIQELYLVINRPKGSKGDRERIKVLLDTGVFDDSNQCIWMCKGYDIKRKCEYDAA
jgi:hypothetical protein